MKTCTPTPPIPSPGDHFLLPLLPSLRLCRLQALHGRPGPITGICVSGFSHAVSFRVHPAACRPHSLSQLNTNWKGCSTLCLFVHQMPDVGLFPVWGPSECTAVGGRGQFVGLCFYPPMAPSTAAHSHAPSSGFQAPPQLLVLLRPRFHSNQPSG